MAEKASPDENLSPEWKENIKIGIAVALDNYELFDQKLDFSPLVITGGVDERSWPELSDTERNYIASQIFSAVGLENQQVGRYIITPPDEATWQGRGEVVVYQTKRSKSDNMYIHEIRRPDVEIEFMVAPINFRL